MLQCESLLFSCPAHNFADLVQSLIALFLAAAGSCCQWKSCKNPQPAAPNSRHTKVVSIAGEENVAAKEPDIILRYWWRPNNPNPNPFVIIFVRLIQNHTATKGFLICQKSLAFKLFSNNCNNFEKCKKKKNKTYGRTFIK